MITSRNAFLDLQSGKGILVKAVGVVDASADTVFEVVLNPDRLRRYEYVRQPFVLGTCSYKWKASNGSFTGGMPWQATWSWLIL